MDVTYFKILNKGQKPRIQTAVFYPNGGRGWQDGIGVSQPETGEYRLECKSSNPFLVPFETPAGIYSFRQDIVNRVRAVREFLESQKAELWDKET